MHAKFQFPFFILFLIPLSKKSFSVLGTRTLNVYLLHSFVIKFFIKYDVYKYFSFEYGIWLLVFPGIIIAYILSLKLFDKILKLPFF